MTDISIQLKVQAIKEKRAVLLRLLEQKNLGTLRLDANQALEELDELILELERTFEAA